MSIDRARYRTVVLFGKEHSHSVAEPERFTSILNALATIIEPACPDLRVRGRIEGFRAKNVAPREAAWAASSAARWRNSLALGRFVAFEMFGPRWSNHEMPLVYASACKIWGYGPDGYTERTRHGAENSVTVAIAHDVDTSQGKWVDQCAQSLGGLTEAFYGFAEGMVPWGRPLTPGSGTYTYTIDMRWHDIPGGPYRRGKYSMDEFAAGVYWGNLWSQAHFRVKPSDLSPDQVDTVSQIGDAVYVRFRKDPEQDSQLRAQLEAMFNLVPSE